ncbi:MAG: hypothetical protein EKK54_00210 [Neisseriaceae bacterium]|nr:MAG: hypothetical protein EKK54_00210 [Neisseriaceae bacterium]
MSYSVTKERVIAASASQLLNYISDFNNWGGWSPWLCLDHETIVNCQHDFLQWESKFTGMGQMKLVNSSTNEVNIDLQFIKPFKSQAKVTFSLDVLSENETKVSWKMESKLPWFLCFFKKMFQVMIGRDFERGLIRLEYMVKLGRVPAKLEYFDIPQKVNGFKIAGLSAVCSMSDIANSMYDTFGKLHELVGEVDIVPLGMVCFCDKFKISKEIMYYTAAAVYDGNIINNSELISKSIPEHKAIKVTLNGSYDFMGDAWAGAYTHVRGLKLKVDKNVSPYEVYIKGPHNTENPEDYITEVYMPVK